MKIATLLHKLSCPPQKTEDHASQQRTNANRETDCALILITTVNRLVEVRSLLMETPLDSEMPTWNQLLRAIRPIWQKPPTSNVQLCAFSTKLRALQPDSALAVTTLLPEQFLFH